MHILFLLCVLLLVSLLSDSACFSLFSAIPSSSHTPHTHVFIQVRRGIDINAGCGQLKNELLAKEILEGGGLASAGVRTTLGKVVVMENKPAVEG